MSDNPIIPPVLNFWLGMALVFALVLALGALIFFGGRLL